MLARIRPRTGADGDRCKRFGERSHDGDRPGFVGEPQRRLAAALVEQGARPARLSPGAGAAGSPDESTRPRRRRNHRGPCRARGSGRGVAQPAEGDRGLAAHGRIAIVEKAVRARSRRRDRGECPPSERPEAGRGRTGRAIAAAIAFRASGPPIASRAQRAWSRPVSGSARFSRSTSGGTTAMPGSDQDSLRFHSNRQRRMIERLDSLGRVVPGRPGGRIDGASRRVTQPEEPPGSAGRRPSQPSNAQSTSQRLAPSAETASENGRKSWQSPLETRSSGGKRRGFRRPCGSRIERPFEPPNHRGRGCRDTRRADRLRCSRRPGPLPRP